MREPFRRSFRLPVRWPIRCRGGGHEFTGMVRDASERGVFIELGAPAPVLSRSTLTLELHPQGRSVEPTFSAEAHVVWRGFNERYECHGLGVKLDEDSPFLLSWHEQACRDAAARA